VLDAQDLCPMTPGTEGPLATYCFKGTTIYRDLHGSRTPMAILDDLGSYWRRPGALGRVDHRRLG
jgi:hypothetical protein